MDIVGIIKNAKIGRERKEAQIETCETFAAALHDVLTELGLKVGVSVACHRDGFSGTWYHGVVEHEGRYYDSLGEFSLEILRARLKIRPKTDYDLTFEPETRSEFDFDEEEYGELYRFLVAEFRKAAKKMGIVPAPAQALAA